MDKLSCTDLSKSKHNLSFAGCGFLGLYHVGVCACIRKFAPQLYLNRPVSGASAGSIAAVCLVCDVNMVDCVQYMCQLIASARQYTLGPFDPRFKISEHLKEGLSRLLPSDAHILSSGRLFISLTNCNTGKNVIVSQYKDRDELISAIMCSAHIPMFSGFMPMTFRGQPVIDGGLSDNLISPNKLTIKVSPFAGDADICPLDTAWGPKYHLAVPQRYDDILGSISFFNNTIKLSTINIKRLVNMVWPMTPDQLINLANQGYADTIRFLTTRGFIACQLHRTPRRFSTFSNERKLSTGSCASSIRTRRLNSHNNLVLMDRHTADDLQTRSAGDNKSPAFGQSPRLYRPSTPTVPLHGSGIGFNVARCVHCQEELRKALGSVLPSYLRDVIRGLPKSQLASQIKSVSIPRKLWNCGYNLIKNGVSYQCRLWNLTYQLISFPLSWQLDFLIAILSRSIHLVDQLQLNTSYLKALLHVFIEVKRILPGLTSTTNLELSSTSQQNDQFSCDLSPNRMPNQSNVFFPTSTVRHQNRDSFTSLFHSVIESSSEQLTDMFLGMNDLELPSALDCGLELFSSNSGDWEDKAKRPYSSTAPHWNRVKREDDSDMSTTEFDSNPSNGENRIVKMNRRSKFQNINDIDQYHRKTTTRHSISDSENNSLNHLDSTSDNNVHFDLN